MPEIILIAGPNGAGKTSFAREYLPKERAGFVFVNADEIAQGADQSGLTRAEIDMRAARQMLQQIDALTGGGEDFVVETTLANLTYAAKIPRWRREGYRVVLIYLRLPNVEASLDRVRRRVAAGGHDIPEITIRRRFAKSLSYLDSHYKPYVWDSLEGSFKLAESWAQHG